MATLALSVAGQFVGGTLFGPIGATIGRAVGALAGNALDQRLFGPESPAPSAEFRLLTSSEGASIPRLYGWSRLAGNVIWATELELLDATGGGAKGLRAKTQEDEAIAASFAVGLCEGEVKHLGRIWADGQLLDTRTVTHRFYPGSEDQDPDSFIEAIQGTGETPAYRGLCYLVFERLDLTEFGNRIPQITVELCRPVGELETRLKSVCVIPGATEFGYDPTPRVRLMGNGVTEPENSHQREGASDVEVSLDELLALAPNLSEVALVVAWFGDDLRADQCTFAPRVIDQTRVVKDTSWVVSGISRSAATEVTEAAGGPAYGGTPSDAAVLAAIADLKARGLKVTLYPFVMMDIAADNTLTDPYTGESGQPAYPWRGRITCDPAPGQPGSPDLSAAAATQVAALMGDAEIADFSAGSGTVEFSGGADFGYRRMVLHYAHLAAMAGGVDAFIIGSEMRGLTTLRTDVRDFPMVDALADLAADVRTVLGSGPDITYAADWSEYHGFQPPEAPGDKLFHLDPLWAAAAITAVGIDNYMPLADWRDGTAHLDRAVADLPHDLGYLQSNIAGGEGFDWYYASGYDRDHQIRTPITDTAYSEPWVWRFKDLVSWWSNAHHHRVDGVRDASPTAWGAESKPIWFTELGCGAVEKGANQPSAFADPKSSEDARPYYSDGSADAAMQRQHLLAHHRWWQPGAPGFDDANNPASGVYSGRMVDPDRLFVWAWDARPFPAFPVLAEEWSDAPSHATGHWLNGRLGAASADELAAAVLADHGIAVADRKGVPPLVDGAVIGRPSTARSALEPLMAATSLGLRVLPDTIEVDRLTARPVVGIAKDALAKTQAPALAWRHADELDRPRRLSLGFADRLADYRAGTAIARIGTVEGHLLSEHTGWSLSPAPAARLAKALLSGRLDGGDAVSVALPPSQAALEPGDRLRLADGTELTIEALRDGALREAEARPVSGRPDVSVIISGAIAAPPVIAGLSEPVVLAATLPPADAGETQCRLLLAAYARPWPGFVTLIDDATGATLATLDRPAATGTLNDDLAAGQPGVWTNAEVEIALFGGHASSAAKGPVLAGTNRIAVRHDDGAWELIGFTTATLVAAETYRLTGLLRGLAKTDFALAAALSAGAPLILMGEGEVETTLDADRLGPDLALTSHAGAADVTGTGFAFATSLDPLRPLAPVHASAVRDAGSNDIDFGWVRRTRLNGNDWSGVEVPLDSSPEAYRLTIFDAGSPVRTIEVGAAAATYTASEQTADFGAPPASFDFTIAQLSPSLGAGHPLAASFGG